jgi:uncharacterized membrane protein YhaH (DUF805 family)
MEWYLMVWKRYAQFSGRSRRKELWMFALINMIVALVLYSCGLAAMVLGRNGNGMVSTLFFGLYFVYVLAALVPGWAVGARRLHDIGKSGWWWLIALVPFVGAILLIVWWATDGQAGDNQYGSNPKAPAPVNMVG